MAHATGRYTSSPESALESDLQRSADLPARDRHSFIDELDRQVRANFTNDYWAGQVVAVGGGLVVAVGSDSHMASAYSMTEISGSERSPQLSERHLRSPRVPRGATGTRLAQHGQRSEPAALLAGRVVQRERGCKDPGQRRRRLASVAGHETATGRGGNAASSCAPVGLASTSYGRASAVAAGAAVVNSSR
jgi:hypothetical protein